MIFDKIETQTEFIHIILYTGALFMLNIKKDDPLYEALDTILSTILASTDAHYITEIYIKNGSIRQGLLTNWIRLMIEVDPEFVNTKLYDVINELEEIYNYLHLTISIEPDTVEKGHGTTIYKRDKK